MMRAIRGLWRTLITLSYRDFWWAEFFSSFALGAWALVNIENPEALSQRNFWVLLKIAPEAFWEKTALAISFMQVLGLVSDSRWARAFSAFLATILLGCIVLNFLQLGHWPPGAVGFYVAGLATNVMAMGKNIVRPDGGRK